MGIYQPFLKQLENDRGDKLIKRLNVPDYSNSYDCFVIHSVKEWAGNQPLREVWQNIYEPVYFAIKSEETQPGDAPLGFQLCLYMSDPDFKKRTIDMLEGTIDGVLGEHERPHPTYVAWTYGGRHIPESKIKEVITKINERIGELPK